MQQIKKFWAWLTTSSQDPDKVALTFRGAMVGVVAAIIQLAPLACSYAGICFDTTFINPLVDAVANLIKVSLELVALVLVVAGILRKIWLGRWTHPSATY